MLLDFIVATASTLVWFASIFLVASIVGYLKSKPLGLQTQLDLVSIDTGLIICFWMTSLYVDIMISVVFEEVEYYASVAILIICHVASLMGMSALLTTSIVRAVLIFWGHLVNDMADGNVRLLARILEGILIVVAHCLDQLTGNTNHIMWDILHKDQKIEGPIAPGLGGVLLMVSLILVITVCHVVVRRNDKFCNIRNDNSIKLLSAYLAGFAIYMLFLILLHFMEQGSIAFMYVQIITGMLVIGVFAPLMIISENANMKTFLRSRLCFPFC